MKIAVTLANDVCDMVANDPEDSNVALDTLVNSILRAHYAAKNKAVASAEPPAKHEFRPRRRDVFKARILENVKKLQPDEEFTVHAVMDAQDKDDPKLRYEYGQALRNAGLPANSVIRYSGRKKGAYKVYVYKPGE